MKDDPKLEEGFRMYIPDYMREGIRHYIYDGIVPGDFLTLLLQRAPWDEVLARADLTNRNNLPNYGAFLFNCVPLAAWGSVEKVANWSEDTEQVRTNYLKLLEDEEFLRFRERLG